MALTPTRWIAAVAGICALVTLDTVARSRRSESTPAMSADSVVLRDLQRRVGEATMRWEALARRDAVLAHLPSHNAAAAKSPALIIDPLLPTTHRSIIERAIQRQWTSLGIDSARVPMTVAVVIDTAISIDRLTTGRGQIAYDYLLPGGRVGAAGQGCLAIVTLESRTLVRPGTHRALAEAVSTPRAASALVGPCAFVARFGLPGVEVDRWLRARAYGPAAYPQWWALPATTSADIGDRWSRANTAGPAPNAAMWLSPEALGCAAGHTEQCAGALPAGDTVMAGGLVIMQRGRDPHWGAMSGRYIADLATALGPERFERFWRSELGPDAALRAVANVSLDTWTHQWAMALVGVQRVGPAPSLAELARTLAVAALFLGLAAWGWGRRQVR